ncbi:BA75_02450T0 [Komagataella pastoris]|uniref:BA75_02450T0 n=1 Tax=Komagataella pastoris TaxID=4922 RepID=A0A1B2JDZ3_PICPA|nr:BA75_02450T0 [Komagataella pastoris]
MLVLREKDVQEVLKGLDPKEIKEFQVELASSLADYNKNPSLIPQRIVASTDAAVHLFMPSLGKNIGLKALTGSSHGFKGIVTLLDGDDGTPIGILNASTLTAFRTALATTLALSKTFKTDDDIDRKALTVFGSGPQAFWHVKLALILYPSVTTVIVVNRSQESGAKLVNDLKSEFQTVSYELHLLNEPEVYSKAVHRSSIIFGCIPSTEPAIKFKDLSTTSKTFIGLIGSYKPHMKEVDDETIDFLVSSNSKILIDSYEHTKHEAGELQSVDTKYLIELGEIWETDSFSIESVNNTPVVLSKIVGLSIMDVSVGADILSRASKLHIGINIDDF